MENEQKTSRKNKSGKLTTNPIKRNGQVKKENTKNFLSPRQLAFIENYYNPESDTYSLKTKSLVKAGYSYEFARSIGNRLPNKVYRKLQEQQALQKTDQERIQDIKQSLDTIVKCLQDTKQRERLQLNSKDIMSALRLSAEISKALVNQTAIIGDITISFKE